ncbi:MAG: hypothetical protein VB088_08040 [Sphaerochaeta sp.]|nr:hypothetical protein [Sphaerochaeta sp.]
MKERPIIFSGESVRAILDGRKSMTRRVVNQRVLERLKFSPSGELLGSFDELHPEWGMYPTVDDAPYQIGDRLWVREAFAFPRIYKADSNLSDLKWKSPMFMSRLMSRLTLEITDIRVERLPDITNDDARAEGIIPEIIAGHAYYLGEFHDFWNSLNAKRGYPWESNPWVWAISFKVVNK